MTFGRSRDGQVRLERFTDKPNRRRFPVGFVIQDAGWRRGQHLMTRPLSNDRRERVVAAIAVAGGDTSSAIVERLGFRSLHFRGARRRGLEAARNGIPR